MPTSTALTERILKTYGPATAVALFLVYWLTTGVSGNIETIKTTLNEHISETAYYLRAICVNTAQDESQRTACIAPRVGH